MIIIGHRGASALESENTLCGIQKALDLGVDQIEIDVHLTHDQYLVVIHDETVDRTTDGHGAVADFTLREIRQLDAGKGKCIPTLQEVIDWVSLGTAGSASLPAQHSEYGPLGLPLYVSRQITDPLISRPAGGQMKTRASIRSSVVRKATRSLFR